MSNSSQHRFFINNKKQFFGAHFTGTGDIDLALRQIDSPLKLTYSELLRQEQALQEEIRGLDEALKMERGRDNLPFLLYEYYCASQLEIYYAAYRQPGEEAKYRAVKERIRNKLNPLALPSAPRAAASFGTALKKRVGDTVQSLANSPAHLSEFRSWVALTNICRIQWTVARLTFTQALLSMQDGQLLNKLDRLLGTHTDVNKIIAGFKVPVHVLNYFSVGLFLTRFMIDLSLLLRHTFLPSEAERAGNTTMGERFKKEFYKRHCNFANDLVWATINFLTNFQQISKIPGPVAAALFLAFLVFDVAMALYKHHLAKELYLAKRAQYLQEMQEQAANLNGDAYRLQHPILAKQLRALEIDWQAKKATGYFVAAAAALLVIGFTASMIVCTPALIFASYFVCTVGVAMYMSAGSYSTYVAKSAHLEDAALLRANSPLDASTWGAAARAQAVARKDFAFTFIKNIVVPSLLMATVMISWPVAILFAAVYLGFELVHAQSQHQGKTEVAKLEQDRDLMLDDASASPAMGM